MKLKKRLDVRLQELYPQYSRNQLASWIMQGNVTVGGKKTDKPGAPVSEESVIELTVEQPRFVCRAGFKLEHALETFGIDVTGLTIMDAGLSTGGFTDCLLQRGAHKVFGIDVGYGQVHEKIRADQRVVVMERTNLRHVRHLGESNISGSVDHEFVDMITLDLSFISILKVMDAIVMLLKPDGILITLIKPQFEAGRADVGPGGIIKDSAVHERVVRDVVAGIQAYGFTCLGITDSPILGAEGNKEFLAYFKRAA